MTRGVLLAAGTVAVAFALELGLEAWTGFAPALLFHAATVATTWWAGAAAGALAAGASFVLAETYFLPQSAFVSPDLESITRAAVFVIASGALVTGVASLRTALRRASASARRTDLLARRLRRKRLESERAASRYQRLQEVAAALLRSLTPLQVMDVIVGAGRSAAEADAALIAVPEGSHLEVLTSAGCPESLASAVREGGSEAVVAALVRGEISWLNGSPLVRDPADNCGMLSWAVLPLWARDRRIGALALGHGAARPFTAEERTFAQLLAQQCAQALDRARLYQSERAARVHAQFAERRLGFLASASASLAGTLDTGRSLAEVADLAATNMGDFCAIHVLDAEGRARLAAGSVTTATGLVRFGGDEHRYELDADSGVGYPAVLRSGRSELLSEIDDSEEDEADAAALGPLRRLGLRSQICVPLVARDTVFGAITVASTERGRRMTTAELSLTEDLARRIAQALDSTQLYGTALQASRAKSDFLAVMSHELRTPLNAILGYADLILMGVPAQVPDETRRQVERMRSAASHLLQLVDDVLNFAKVESGRDRVRVESIPLAVAVAEAVGMVEPLARGKGLALRQDAPAGAVLRTDGPKLVRILHNLLSNAVKFTDSGSVAVEAAVVGDEAVVTVTDTGIGIPPEHRERIFDPFWQVEQSATRRYGGAGIGLGVARHLSRLLGGDLVARSTPGEGSTFELRIPLRYRASPGREA